MVYLFYVELSSGVALADALHRPSLASARAHALDISRRYRGGAVRIHDDRGLIDTVSVPPALQSSRPDATLTVPGHS